jgi:acyl-ACP thioesterase
MVGVSYEYETSAAIATSIIVTHIFPMQAGDTLDVQVYEGRAAGTCAFTSDGKLNQMSIERIGGVM